MNFLINNTKRRMKRDYTLIIEPGGGLCNRLIGINNAINFSRAYPNIRICVTWWKEPECGCKYDDILKKLSYFNVKNYAKPMVSSKEYLAEGKVMDAIKSLIKKSLFAFYYRNNNSRRISGIFLKKFESEKELFDEIERHRLGTKVYYRMGAQLRTKFVFNETMFSNIVLEKANNIIRNIHTKEYIGVHIRRTDHKIAILKSPISFFFDSLDQEIKENGDISFYLATDDKDVETKFTERYGDKIVTNFNCERGRMTSSAIQDAAADLVILAGAIRIYGSVDSTFSEFAAKMGKIPLILSHSEM